jgi:hypothetical protein
MERKILEKRKTFFNHGALPLRKFGASLEKLLRTPLVKKSI